MNRDCHSVTLLFAILTGSLLAVSTSHGQCWMDGRIGLPNRGLCPIAMGQLDQGPSCYVVRPPFRPEHFLSEYDVVHDREVYRSEPAVTLPAVANSVAIEDVDDVTNDVGTGADADEAIAEQQEDDTPHMGVAHIEATVQTGSDSSADVTEIGRAHV